MTQDRLEKAARARLEKAARAPRACADVARFVLSALPATDDDETRQALVAAAWHDFMLAAFHTPNARAWFRDDTGIDLDTPRSPIAQLIDNATGREQEMLERFIVWATEKLWGFEFAPKTYQDELAKRREAERRSSEVTP